MKSLDLHHYTINEAIRRFIKFYNKNYKSEEMVEIIHGYGASGSGGGIRKTLREFLDSQLEYLDYITGEEASANPGVTIVIMIRRIPEVLDLLSQEIVAFCDTPKTIDKISGNFRNYTQQEIIKSLKTLEKTGKLKTVIKGKHKCYINK